MNYKDEIKKLEELVNERKRISDKIHNRCTIIINDYETNVLSKMSEEDQRLISHIEDCLVKSGSIQLPYILSYLEKYSYKFVNLEDQERVKTLIKNCIYFEERFTKSKFMFSEFYKTVYDLQ